MSQRSACFHLADVELQLWKSRTSFLLQLQSHRVRSPSLVLPLSINRPIFFRLPSMSIVIFMPATGQDSVRLPGKLETQKVLTQLHICWLVPVLLLPWTSWRGHILRHPPVLSAYMAYKHSDSSQTDGQTVVSVFCSFSLLWKSEWRLRPWDSSFSRTQTSDPRPSCSSSPYALFSFFLSCFSLLFLSSRLWKIMAKSMIFFWSILVWGLFPHWFNPYFYTIILLVFVLLVFFAQATARTWARILIYFLPVSC